MASFSDMTDLDLDRQISSLSRELAALKTAAAKRGGAYYEEGRQAAQDAYSDLAGRIGEHLPALRSHARAIEGTARRHPATTAAIGLAVVGLLAATLLSRR
jgi:ElaB/YqjD/DUF883 family membrane-anchored ribosome-binding protein